MEVSRPATLVRVAMEERLKRETEGKSWRLEGETPLFEESGCRGTQRDGWWQLRGRRHQDMLMAYMRRVRERERERGRESPG